MHGKKFYSYLSLLNLRVNAWTLTHPYAATCGPCMLGIVWPQFQIWINCYLSFCEIQLHTPESNERKHKLRYDFVLWEHYRTDSLRTKILKCNEMGLFQHRQTGAHETQTVGTAIETPAHCPTAVRALRQSLSSVTPTAVFTALLLPIWLIHLALLLLLGLFPFVLNSCSSV